MPEDFAGTNKSVFGPGDVASCRWSSIRRSVFYYDVLGVKRKTMLDRVNVTRCAIHFATILILQVEFLKSVQTVLKWSQFFLHVSCDENYWN